MGSEGNMGNPKRGRLIVNKDGDWRQYAGTLPAHAEPLGTVSHEGGGIGALVRLDCTTLRDPERVYQYVQYNNGMAAPLDQRKAKAALGIGNGAGAPPKLRGGRAHNVYLDEASIAAALALGAGNISEGIRVALTRTNKPA